MKINTIPQNFLYNVIRQDIHSTEIEKRENDFFLRVLKITNDTDYALILRRCTFHMKSNGAVICSQSYNQEEINKRFGVLYQFSQRYLTKKDSPLDIFRQFSLQSQLGIETFWDGHPIASSSILQPHEVGGLMGMHFQFTGVNTEIIDSLSIEITYETNGETLTSKKDLAVKQYQNKGEYIFPLSGVWQVFSNYNDFSNHRDSYSQEYALDLITFDLEAFKNATGQQPNESYPSYNAPVLAVGDGVVVDIIDVIPENPSSLQMLPKEEMIELGLNYGVAAVTAGNQVIIDHQNGEYSLYAHLIPGTITVKKGEVVKRGKTIGRLGNSGNSDAPHLHFQLMDSPSLATGRGLPCAFTNLVDMFGFKIQQISEPKIIVFGRSVTI